MRKIVFDAQKLAEWDSGLLTFQKRLRKFCQEKKDVRKNDKNGRSCLWSARSKCSWIGAQIYVANLVGIAMVRLLTFPR